ncbi:MAG: hypothetical protein PHQ43_01145 [Dehalococcoidales bacterium]|nr:hypothetical protein [Dehalococcoidales bacterium]
MKLRDEEERKLVRELAIQDESFHGLITLLSFHGVKNRLNPVDVVTDVTNSMLTHLAARVITLEEQVETLRNEMIRQRVNGKEE